MTIGAHIEDAWNSIQFYEQVKQSPPLLLRIVPSLRPLYTTGSSAHVGDMKVCVYAHGRLVKQITEIIPGKRLAFRVVEQKGVEDDGVRLIGGAFELSPSADGQSTIINPGRKFDQVASNTLDDGLMASPAIDGHALYLRTKTHLYRIENSDSSASAQ